MVTIPLKNVTIERKNDAPDPAEKQCHDTRDNRPMNQRKKQSINAEQTASRQGCEGDFAVNCPPALPEECTLDGL